MKSIIVLDSVGQIGSSAQCIGLTAETTSRHVPNNILWSIMHLAVGSGLAVVKLHH